MNLKNLFSGLANAIILEETTTQEGETALASELYTFISAEEPSKKVGSVICDCIQNNTHQQREISALALLELIKDGESTYIYSDMMLGMCRVLGGVAKFGESDTFIKKLTIVS